MMNMKSCAALAVMACALESAAALFFVPATGVATGLTTLEITGLGAGATVTSGAAGAALLTGGVLLLKGLAIFIVCLGRGFFVDDRLHHMQLDLIP